MNKVFALLAAIALAFVIVVGIAILISFPVMWLWNWLMPAIFGLKVITWTQALGLMVLSGLLVRSGSYTHKS